MSAAFGAGVAYFAAVFAAGFLLGIGRVLVLAPSIGSVASVLVELPFILAIAWTVCRRLIHRFHLRPGWKPRLVMGVVAFALLMGAEAALGVIGFGRSLGAQLRSYQDLGPLLGLAGQVAFAAFPLIAERRAVC